DELGCREVWIKNDSVCHPTWSFKDRVVAVAVSKAREFGFDTVACASTGNLAHALAAAAQSAGLRCVLFVPAGAAGARVVTVRGSYDDAQRLSNQVLEARPWGFVNVNLWPFYVEGSKTVG